ncbi:MAG TPA: hypothetical protein VMU30_11780 [Bacteroidota bacterium]|nr:hypothetical protein [Bacteroidota bacterium]
MNFRRMLFLAGAAILVVLGTTAFLQQDKKQESGAPQMKELLARDHSISLQEAKELIKARNAGTKATEIKGGMFNRKIFDKILAQKGCVAIRYYYAQTKDGKPTIVLVGVDAKGKDMTKAGIAEKSLPCPPWCDANTELSK